MSRSKFFATKQYLHDSISDRIQYIASTEYGDVHLQLIDNANSMFTMLRTLFQKAAVQNDRKTLQWVSEELRHYTELIKDLYAASPIVGRTQQIIREKLKQAEALRDKVDQEKP